MIRLSSVDPVEEILGGKSTPQDKAEGKHLTESLDLFCRDADEGCRQCLKKFWFLLMDPKLRGTL